MTRVLFSLIGKQAQESAEKHSLAGTEMAVRDALGLAPGKKAPDLLG